MHRSRELELSNELKERNVARKVQVLAVEMSVDQHRRRADEEKQRSAELATLNEKLTETLERAEHYASHDSLTELLNRRKFLDLTEEAVQRAQATGEILGLAFVDLDGFKLINDTLGHDAGRCAADPGGAPPERCCAWLAIWCRVRAATNSWC